MAEANIADATNGVEKKLSDIFLTGWNLYDDLEVSDLPFNGSEFQVNICKISSDICVNILIVFTVE